MHDLEEHWSFDDLMHALAMRTAKASRLELMLGEITQHLTRRG